jgi:hypothetical protein
MKLVAYYPKGILAPIALLAVMVPVGVVTDKIWIQALSDRISEMIDLESNPQVAAEQACKALDCPHCSDPDQLGQYIVEGNLNLRTWINNSIISDEDPFSASATEDNPKALKAIQSTNLKTWVRHAKKLMTGEALENYMRSHPHG